MFRVPVDWKMEIGRCIEYMYFSLKYNGSFEIDLGNLTTVAHQA